MQVIDDRPDFGISFYSSQFDVIVPMYSRNIQ